MSSMPDPAPVVLCRDLRKTFRRESGDAVQALDGIAAQADAGAR